MRIAAIIERFGRSRAMEQAGVPAPHLGDHDHGVALERLEWFGEAASAPQRPAPQAVGRARLGMWPH